MTIEKISDKLAHCEPFFWIWTTNKLNQHPVKIRVTFNRKSKYYSVLINGEKMFLTPDKWEELIIRQPKDDDTPDKDGKFIGFKSNLRSTNREIVKAINGQIAEARKAVTKITQGGAQFTHAEFENNFLQKTVDGGFLSFFQNHLDELRAAGRIGSYVAYKNALSAFKAFRRDREINPIEITPKLLRDFESWLKTPKTSTTKKNKKRTRQAGETTIAMYMRGIKVVYNKIARKHPELMHNYPFAIGQNDDEKYQIPEGSGDHKGTTLKPETVSAFNDIQTEPGTPEHEAKLYFMFSFFVAGMNMRDIAHLKNKNVTRNEMIDFERQKTSRTTKRKVKIQVTIDEEVQGIIDELSTGSKDPNDYVFPILSANMNPAEQDRRIRQFIKVTNQNLKSLCQKSNIEPFTTYSARHTFANILKQKDMSTELIREFLGHKDLKTTENYLKRFDLDKNRKATRAIMEVVKRKTA